MSVVAAKIEGDHITISADSIVVRNYSTKRVDQVTKLAKEGDLIIGSVGAYAECSAMWQFMVNHKPIAPTERDVLSFMMEFVQWKADYLHLGTDMTNAYLICYKGHLFEAEGLYVFEVKNYSAIGAGQDFATAALYLGHTPQEAVNVAAELSCFVAKPIITFIQERDEK